MKRQAIGIVAMMMATTAGCGKKKPSDGEPAAASGGGSPSANVEKATATRKPTPTQATAETVRTEVTALVSRWNKAQIEGDFAGYKKLYHPHFFQGVKRTTSGKVARLDYKGWLVDRERMFKKPVEVVLEDLEVTTWHDPGSKLKPGVSSVRFLQRWKSGNYADHGIKIVHVWRDPKGAQRIVYEDLVNAERGWSDEVTGVEKLALTAPKTDAEALALWKSLAITGANYGAKLAALPEDEATSRALARALVAGSNFNCTEITQSDQCGEEYLEWEPLKPESTFESPCLRRRLAEWALAQLDEKEIGELSPQLAEMAGISGPSDDLVGVALDRALETSTPAAVRVARAASEAGHAESVEAALEGKTSAALLIALYEGGVPLAGKALARLADVDGPHTRVLLKILADTQIDIETRATLVGPFIAVKKEGVNEALRAVAGEEHCALSMSAAEALAERGETSALPKHAGTTDATAAITLCRLLAGVSQYADKEADKFFPEDGVSFTETVETETYPDYDENGNVVETEAEEEAEGEEPDDQTIDRDEFEALDPFNDNEVKVGFGADKSGNAVVDSVEKYTYHGCGC